MHTPVASPSSFVSSFRDCPYGGDPQFPSWFSLSISYVPHLYLLRRCQSTLLKPHGVSSLFLYIGRIDTWSSKALTSQHHRLYLHVESVPTLSLSSSLFLSCPPYYLSSSHPVLLIFRGVSLTSASSAASPHLETQSSLGLCSVSFTSRNSSYSQSVYMRSKVF